MKYPGRSTRHPLHSSPKCWGSELYIADTLSRDCHDIPEPDAQSVYKVQVMIPMSAQRIAQLKDLHFSHKGVQGTLAIAHDHVVWPGMMQCAICQKIQNDPPQESLSKETVKTFFLFADSYSGYFDFHVLTSSTSNEVIKTLKVWFAQHGICDELRTDGGPQYASHQFQNLREEWNFQHRISKAKNLLAKCEEDQSDIWVALLHHRNTPRGNLGSPVQRLMGRRTETTLPSSTKLLQPALIKGVRQNLTTCRQTEIDRVNRNRHKPTPLQATQEVLLLERYKQWVPAEVVQTAPNSRSYIIHSPRGRYRRNSWLLKPLKCERPQPAQDKDPRQGATISAQQTRILQAKLKGELSWIFVMNTVLRLAPVVWDYDGGQLEVI
ncbi:hypothetical protein PR048_032603 [Dryococelus australis]|uniref:Integrase catalytic domain-containing protein n=1 Tax=Dryococelus australis TaxID=614101 RepID=A0ABQ9G5M3_9NEOP|nr:hypothetical protein PR048_032603 [Dryococelus australis]